MLIYGKCHHSQIQLSFREITVFDLSYKLSSGEITVFISLQKSLDCQCEKENPPLTTASLVGFLEPCRLNVLLPGAITE